MMKKEKKSEIKRETESCSRKQCHFHTHSRAWYVAHQISLHAQQTDRCKCGMRITVDHVRFECRFVKPPWAFFEQPNGLYVNQFTPQTQQAFLDGALFQSIFRRKKDAWCDMIQCCGWPSMDEMVALQQHHPQSQMPVRIRLDKRGKVGQHSSTNILIDAAKTQWLWNTRLWLTIKGWYRVSQNL